jgi:hypothetical protein
MGTGRGEFLWTRISYFVSKLVIRRSSFVTWANTGVCPYVCPYHDINSMRSATTGAIKRSRHKSGLETGFRPSFTTGSQNEKRPAGAGRSLVHSAAGRGSCGLLRLGLVQWHVGRLTDYHSEQPVD